MDLDSKLSPVVWVIPSSSGRDLFGCRISSNIRANPACDISITTNILGGKGDLASEVKFELGPIRLNIDALTALCNYFRTWDGTMKDVCIDLVCKKNNNQDKFIINIGQIGDLIYRRDRPGLSLIYAPAWSVGFHCNYVIDQTCIDIAAETLEKLVADIKIYHR